MRPLSGYCESKWNGSDPTQISFLYPNPMPPSDLTFAILCVKTGYFLALGPLY